MHRRPHTRLSTARSVIQDEQLEDVDNPPTARTARWSINVDRRILPNGKLKETPKVAHPFRGKEFHTGILKGMEGGKRDERLALWLGALDIFAFHGKPVEAKKDRQKFLILEHQSEFLGRGRLITPFVIIRGVFCVRILPL